VRAARLALRVPAQRLAGGETNGHRASACTAALFFGLSRVEVNKKLAAGFGETVAAPDHQPLAFDHHGRIGQRTRHLGKQARELFEPAINC
jgi:hypothetical protein